MMKTKYFFTSLLLILLSITGAYSQDTLFRSYPKLERARVGLLVKHLQTDSIVIDNNAGELFSPASNTKLFTTALALHNLEHGFHFQTPVMLFGNANRRGVFTGLAVIKTSGDPSLSSINYKHRNNPVNYLQSMFSTMNIHTFKGDIWIDEQVKYDGTTPRDWLFDDLSMPWGAGVFASAFNDNVYYYLENKEIVQIWDTIALDGWNAMADTDPGISMLKYLDYAISSSKVKYIKKLPEVDFSQPIISDTIRSDSLFSLIQEINYESRNMWAESLLMEATTHPDSIRRFRPSADSLSRFWREKLDEPRIYFHDGSGMSPYNSVSPKAIVGLLKYMTGTEVFSSFLASLPAPGEGTLDDMHIKLDNGRTIRMKSGSFTRVRCYSGYILDVDGNPEYAFSLMVNDFDCSHREMKEEIGAFLETFFSSEPR